MDSVTLEKNGKNRIVYLDNLKGFAIILVVFGHVAEKYLFFDSYPEYNFIYKMIYDIVYSFHMPLFMIVSGFLYSTAYYDDYILNKPRIKKHCINLIIVYILISIIVWGAKCCFNGDVLHPVDMSSLLLIWINPIGHLWYLHLLLLMYVVNVYIIQLIKTDHTNMAFLVMLMANIMSKYMVFGDVYLLSRFMKYELFFFIGILWCCKEDFWLFSYKSIIALLLITAICAILYFPQMVSGLPFQLLGTLVSIGISVSIFSLFRKRCNKDIKLFSELGGKSLEIYLLHQFPVTILQLLMGRISFIDGMISLLLNFVLSICSVLLVIYVMKRIKIYNLFFRPYYIIHELPFN